jgi:hypothetical protein
MGSSDRWTPFLLSGLAARDAEPINFGFWIGDFGLGILDWDLGLAILDALSKAL